MNYTRVQIISLTNDVYLAAIRLVVRAENETNSRDYLFMLANDDKNRQSPIVVQEWAQECLKIAAIETFSPETAVAAVAPVMPTMAEINASPIVEVIKENLAAQAEAVTPEVIEKPVEAPKKTRAKSTPPVVKATLEAAAEKAEVNPKIAAAQAEVAASVTPVTQAALSPIAAEPEVELDLTEEAPVVAKPEVIRFIVGDKPMTTAIYPLIDTVHATWRKDAAYIAKLKPLLIKLAGKDMYASKDSTEMLLGFQQQVLALATSIK